MKNHLEKKWQRTNANLMERWGFGRSKETTLLEGENIIESVEQQLAGGTEGLDYPNEEVNMCTQNCADRCEEHFREGLQEDAIDDSTAMETAEGQPQALAEEPMAEEEGGEEYDRHRDAAKDDWDHIVRLARDAHADHLARTGGGEDEETRDRHRDAAEDDWAHIHALAKDAHMDREDESLYRETQVQEMVHREIMRVLQEGGE